MVSRRKFLIVMGAAAGAAVLPSAQCIPQATSTSSGAWLLQLRPGDPVRLAIGPHDLGAVWTVHTVTLDAERGTVEATFVQGQRSLRIEVTR
jgi:hypothetical protein